MWFQGWLLCLGVFGQGYLCRVVPVFRIFHIHSIPQTNLSVQTTFWILKEPSVQVSEARKVDMETFVP